MPSVPESESSGASRPTARRPDKLAQQMVVGRAVSETARSRSTGRAARGPVGSHACVRSSSPGEPRKPVERNRERERPQPGLERIGPRESLGRAGDAGATRASVAALPARTAHRCSRCDASTSSGNSWSRCSSQISFGSPGVIVPEVDQPTVPVRPALTRNGSVTPSQSRCDPKRGVTEQRDLPLASAAFASGHHCFRHLRAPLRAARGSLAVRKPRGDRNGARPRRSERRQAPSDVPIRDGRRSTSARRLGGADRCRVGEDLGGLHERQAPPIPAEPSPDAHRPPTAIAGGCPLRNRESSLS